MAPMRRALAGTRMVITLGLAALTMNGCMSTGADSGVFVVRFESGAPEWIGGLAGIPIWSPINDTVVWGGEDGLFFGAPGVGGATMLFDSAVAGRPAWSPDGKALAVIDRDRASLVVLDADSGNVQFNESISHESTGATGLTLVTLGGPTWAPDGSQLAFVCWDGAGDEICIIQADGSGRRQVTHLEPAGSDRGGEAARRLPAASNTGPPAWSPDGRFLAVAAYPERRGAPSGVFIIDIEQGSARRVTSIIPNSAISWFPDGGSLLFSASQEGRSDAHQISVFEGIDERLTTGLPAGARNPALSSDGELLAVESDGGIVVFGRQGGTQAFSVPAVRGTYPSWNRDGNAIVFAADIDPIASYN